MKRIIKTLLTVILIIAIVGGSFVIAEPQKYQYTGTNESGHSYGGVGTAKFYMTDNYIAFCIDVNTTIKTKVNYIKLDLEHEKAQSYITNPDKIRAILNYAWSKSGKDEITAIQYALWHYMHEGHALPAGASQTVKNLYNKIIDLPGISKEAANINNIFTLAGPETILSSSKINKIKFIAESDEDIIFKILVNGIELDETLYDITKDSDGKTHFLELKNIYFEDEDIIEIRGTTLKTRSIGAWAFFPINDDGEIQMDLSQTVAGFKLEESTQTKSFRTVIKYRKYGSLKVGKRVLDSNGDEVIFGRNDKFNFIVYFFSDEEIKDEEFKPIGLPGGKISKEFEEISKGIDYKYAYYVNFVLENRQEQVFDNLLEGTIVVVIEREAARYSTQNSLLKCIIEGNNETKLIFINQIIPPPTTVTEPSTTTTTTTEEPTTTTTTTEELTTTTTEPPITTATTTITEKPTTTTTEELTTTTTTTEKPTTTTTTTEELTTTTTTTEKSTTTTTEELTTITTEPPTTTTTEPPTTTAIEPSTSTAPTVPEDVPVTGENMLYYIAGAVLVAIALVLLISRRPRFRK